MFVLPWLNGNSQNISRFEYFFDSDPGYGNGQSLSVSPDDVVSLSSNLNLASISDGIHTLYFRAKESGRWSQTHSKVVGISGGGQLTKGEYFWDNDPGYGNGIPIPVASGSLVNLSFSPNMSSLSNGIHTLNMRVFDGGWSQTFSKLVGIYSAPTNVAYMVEYFFDTDPGYMNGTIINGSTNTTISFSPDISGLSPGLHTFYSRLIGGISSQTFHKHILVVDDVNNPLGFEYFFDTDPGYGNGTPLSATPISSGVYSISTNISTSALSTGIHILNIRAYNGQYGHTFTKIIGVYNNPTASNYSAEYFFDNDPGMGNATAITSSAVNGTTSFNVDLSSINPGLNSFNIRVFEGAWSHTYSKMIFVTGGDGISEIEYFIDTDPGFGNGTPISFTTGNDVAIVNFNAVLSSLSAGYHTIGVRARAGDWGHTHTKEFYISENQNITQAEYFFNSDPGFGNGTPLSVTSGKVVSLNFQPDLSTLSAGKNYFVARVKTADNQWSLIHSDSICITAKADFSFDTVCFGNAVSFTNLTTGTGSGSSYSWDVNGDGTTDYTNSGNFTHSYSSAGTYSVKLIVSEIGGCADTIIKQVWMRPTLTPAVSISESGNSICSGTSVTFTATPTNGGATPSYAWKVNGQAAGTNSSQFTSSALNNGDVVTVVMTSSETCVTSATATSNGITMIVNPNLTPAVSISESVNSICSGTSVIFTATPTNGGATPSYAWKVNGQAAGTNNAQFTTSALNNGDVVTVVMTSSETCVTSATAISNGITMIVNPNLTPAVSISESVNSICSGTSVIFTATPTNGGATPSYAWKVNGQAAGTNNAQFTSSALNNGDVVTVVMTSSETCLTSATATSNGITMIVNPNLTPAVSISESVNSVCSGTSVTFTATPTNGGVTPSYAWKVNGQAAGTNNAQFTTSALNNGDVVTVVMTSSETCVTSATDTSNGITMIVNPNLTPAVSISESVNSICSGTSVTFTATPTNGGATPSYAWKVNGQAAGTNNAQFTTSALNNGDVVTVVMTSSETCVTSATATSNGITMIVNPNLTPVVSINASNTTICTGMSVSFTANPVHGGLSPVYQWKLNGNVVGTNSAVYSNSNLQNNDTISLMMISSETCVTTSTAIANDVIMQVSSTFTPQVYVTTNDTVSCAGSSVIFTANPINGGASPSFLWLKNGNTVGTNSATYTASGLQTGDNISVIMTSSETCASPSSDTSNAISVIVNPLVTPTVSISASDTNICFGTQVTFSASSTNSGSMPSYIWKVNGNPSGNGAIFNSSILQNGDQVKVEMTSSEACANPQIVSSSTIQMIVNPVQIPSVSISATDTTICAGSPVTFTATATNGGSTPVYSWKLNGNAVGTNSSIFTTSSLQNNDSVWVVMQSSESCAQPDSAVSDAIVMTIYPIPPTPVVIQLDSVTLQSSVSGTSYEWFMNGFYVPVNSQILHPPGNGGYQVLVIENGCKSDTSLMFNYYYDKIEINKEGVELQLYPNPNNGYFVIEIKQLNSNPLELKIYDSRGALVLVEKLGNSVRISKQIHIEPLAKGVYHLQLNDSQGFIQHRKIVIQ